MNAEQRRRTEEWAALINGASMWPLEKTCACLLNVTEAKEIAALLRAGIAASEECERMREYLSNPLQAEKPCGRCGGRGRRAYPSTATFWGGIGGASITDGVCNACWGSGDEWNKNPDVRRTEGAWLSAWSTLAGLQTAEADCKQAWLAAWDAEWRAQEKAAALEWQAACTKALLPYQERGIRFRALLVRAAGLLRIHAHAYATDNAVPVFTVAETRTVLAEIEGAL